MLQSITHTQRLCQKLGAVSCKKSLEHKHGNAGQSERGLEVDDHSVRHEDGSREFSKHSAFYTTGETQVYSE